MSYKVFLVEDEIVTREGIRNAVDWDTVEFELCGDASDGEMALPRIEACKPDVLLTDIKMPFMDGLQLSKIIREYMPWVKIIILSGYDEFEYAQTALKLGVTEYLLKPISSSDIVDVLKRVKVTLDQEKSEREKLKQLRNQVAYNVHLRRDQVLLRLVMGGISSGDAIDQGQNLGLDLVASHYLVMLVKIIFCDGQKPYDYHAYEQVENLISNLIGDNADILIAKKGLEELILILKGDDAKQLQQDGIFWAELIRQENVNNMLCDLHIGIGSPQERLSDLHSSFAEAWVSVRNIHQSPSPTDSQKIEEHLALQKLDHRELENYLKFGDCSTFEGFFNDALYAICESALHSELVKHYLFLEVFLTVAQFVSDLGSADSLNTVELSDVEQILHQVTNREQLRDELKCMICDALALRDAQVHNVRTMLIHQAKAYIDEHFRDPDLKMTYVAQKFNFSTSHFSTIFGQEIGESYRDYVNNLRINHAKELLRTTNVTCAKVAYQSGYNDAHYFSTFFKRKTGFSPQQFRRRSQLHRH